MTEKVIENWLINAKERVFQHPFASSLLNEGHNVVHVSRHCAMELGKDIISIAPDGVPCAFQLKNLDGKKLNITKWRNISSQITDLIHLKLKHPSLPNHSDHRSFLVLNGELEEEVIRVIGDINESLDDKRFGNRKLRVITKGDLVKRFIDLGVNFWPNEPSDIKIFLELYLQDGSDLVDKESLSEFISSHFDLNKEELTYKKNDLPHKILSIAILMSIAISDFVKKENYSQEFESWVLLISQIYGLIEKEGFDKQYWASQLTLLETFFYNSLSNIYHEFENKEIDIISKQGVIENSLLFGPKLLYLASLLSIYGIHLILNSVEKETEEKIRKIKNFIQANLNRLEFWGEYCSPQFFSIYCFLRLTDARYRPVGLLARVIRTISAYGANKNLKLLDPYQPLDEWIDLTLDQQEKYPINESYSLKTFWELFLKYLWKQTAKSFYPQFSKVPLSEFVPKNKHDYFKWRAKEGTTNITVQELKQSWKDWHVKAHKIEKDSIPDILLDKPFFNLCLMQVMPHRLNANSCKYIINEFRNEKYG